MQDDKARTALSIGNGVIGLLLVGNFSRTLLSSGFTTWSLVGLVAGVGLIAIAVVSFIRWR